MKKRALIITLLFMFVAVSTGIASDSMQFRAGHLEYGSDIIKLRDGVTIFRDDITIRAEWGEIYRQRDQALLEEDVEMTLEEDRITSRKLEVLLEENRYIFQEEVVFYRQQADRDIELRSPYLELNEDDDTFSAREGVEIDYGDRRLLAENADYEQETDQLILTDSVEIEDEDDGWIRGKRAVFYLEDEEDRFEVEGDVEMEIEI